MEQKSGITITVRDRLLRAWEDAMAQVKAFELWSSEIEDEEVAAEHFCLYQKCCLRKASL